MEAVIKVKVSEFDALFLDRIKNLLTGNKDEIITITFGSDNEYLSTLLQSKNDLEERKDLISFTMEELVSYTNEKKK